MTRADHCNVTEGEILEWGGRVWGWGLGGADGGGKGGKGCRHKHKVNAGALYANYKVCAPLPNH